MAEQSHETSAPAGLDRSAASEGPRAKRVATTVVSNTLQAKRRSADRPDRIHLDVDADCLGAVVTGRLVVGAASLDRGLPGERDTRILQLDRRDPGIETGGRAVPRHVRTGQPRLAVTRGPGPSAVRAFRKNS